MKALSSLLIVPFSVLFVSCSKGESPVKPPEEPAIRLLYLGPYGTILDSSYYKLFSDGSWEQFHRVLTLNGRTYVTELNSDSNEYYYDVAGYAGFKPKGDSLILFNSSLPGLPDTIEFGKAYTRSTSFIFQGYVFTMNQEQTLVDTPGIAVPFGVFTGCAHFRATVTLQAGGQSDATSSQFWVGRGPGTLQTMTSGGVVVQMVKGRVNGRGWGMPYPAPTRGTDKTALHLSPGARDVQSDSQDLASMRERIRGILLDNVPRKE
jgi:hypothetical protein